MIRLAPHAFEGIKVKGRHRLAAMDATEVAVGVGEALQETIQDAIAAGHLSAREKAAIADLLGASGAIHLQITFDLAEQLQTFPS